MSRRLGKPFPILVVGVLLIIAAILSVVTIQVGRYQSAIEFVEARGGKLDIVGPSWLRRMVGERYFPIVDVVKSVNLNWNNVPESQCTSLMESISQFDKLERLMLAGISITDDDYRQIRHLKRLQVLDLSNSKVTDQSLPAIAQCHGLRQLALAGTGITDEGLASLSRLSQLRSLNLDHTQISDMGLVSLNSLGNLSELSVVNCDVTDSGVEPLLRVRPNLAVSDD